MFRSLFISLLILFAGSGSVSDNTREVILDKARDAVSKQYDPESYRFKLSARWIPESLLSADPDEIVAVEMQGSLKRYSTFEVTYQRYDRSEQAEIQLKVDTEQYLPVPLSRLISGQRLSEDQFHMQWISVDPERDRMIDSIRKLNGNTLRRTLNAGQPVEASFISTPFMVEAGENVNMLYKGTGIDIVMSCEARQNGAVSEEIRIYCKETRRKYLARVPGRGEATWVKTQ